MIEVEMAGYAYKVLKGEKIVAEATTYAEAQAEAKRVGGHVLSPLSKRNPATDTKLARALSFEAKLAKRNPADVAETIAAALKDRRGGDHSVEATPENVAAIRQMADDSHRKFGDPYGHWTETEGSYKFSKFLGFDAKSKKSWLGVIWSTGNRIGISQSKLGLIGKHDGQTFVDNEFTRNAQIVPSVNYFQSGMNSRALMTPHGKIDLTWAPHAQVGGSQYTSIMTSATGADAWLIDEMRKLHLVKDAKVALVNPRTSHKKQTLYKVHGAAGALPAAESALRTLQKLRAEAKTDKQRQEWDKAIARTERDIQALHDEVAGKQRNPLDTTFAAGELISEIVPVVLEDHPLWLYDDDDGTFAFGEPNTEFRELPQMEIFAAKDGTIDVYDHIYGGEITLKPIKNWSDLPKRLKQFTKWFHGTARLSVRNPSAEQVGQVVGKGAHAVGRGLLAGAKALGRFAKSAHAGYTEARAERKSQAEMKKILEKPSKLEISDQELADFMAEREAKFRAKREMRTQRNPAKPRAVKLIGK